MKKPLSLYETPSYSLKYAVALFGDVGVGKTTFVENLKGNPNPFNPKPDATIGTQVNFIELEQYYLLNTKIAVEIYDLAGRDSFHSLISHYVSKVDTCILICDLNNKHSFTRLPTWLEKIREQNCSLRIILLGTKADLEQEVSEEELKNFADSNRLILASPFRIDLHIKGIAKQVISHVLENTPKFQNDYNTARSDAEVAKSRAIQILNEYKDRRNRDKDWLNFRKGDYSKACKLAAANVVIEYIDKLMISPTQQKPPTDSLYEFAATITQKGIFGNKRLRVAYGKALQLLRNTLPSLEDLENFVKNKRT